MENISPGPSEKLVDGIRLRGALRIHLLDPDGKILQERILNNLIVLGGRSWVLGQLETTNQATARTVSHMGIGSGLVAPVTGNTGLGNEVTRLAIASFDTTLLTANPPSWTAQCTFATSDANTTLGEVAMFNSSAVGTMLNRATFASFVKATSNTLAISFTISA
jgi:hypothetical protein